MTVESNRRRPVCRGGAAARATGALRGLAAALLLGASACQGIFDAQNKDAVTGGEVTGPDVQPAVIGGVIQNFATAYDFLITDVGVVADELVTTGTWSTYTDADQRGLWDLTSPDIQAGNIPEAHWNTLQTTRALAERAYANLKAAGSVDANPLAAMARLYSGMSDLFLGELSCDVAFDNGPGQPPSDAIALAESQLTEASTIAVTAGVDSLAHLAYLMRARARFEQGNTAGAAEDARAVPDGFLWLSYPVVRGAQSWLWTHVDAFATATTGPAFRATGDPRVPIEPRPGEGGSDDLFIPRKYPDGDSPEILGSWQEARLIEAEVDLQGGDTAGGIALINQVRADAGLAPISSSASAAEALAALKAERRNALFLEGRRLQDMQRYGESPPEYAGATPFAQLCIPVPQSERDNNPNLGQVHETR